LLVKIGHLNRFAFRKRDLRVSPADPVTENVRDNPRDAGAERLAAWSSRAAACGREQG
jgi:hypothetical protein